MAKNGQAATELIIILGVALVVVVLFFVLSANMLTGARSQQNYDDARVSVQSLAEAADSVYAQGEGAARKVAITLPADTVFGSNYTYIGAPSSSFAAQNSININVNGTDVSGVSRTSLSGQFPAKPGKYTMRVTSRGSYVEIYPYLVDVDKRSITIVMAHGETRSAQITVTRASLEKVTVEPSQNWGFTDVEMEIAPSSAFGASNAGTVITVTVTARSFASGIYNSQITLTATGNESETSETINIPVSVNVIGSGGECILANAACNGTGQCCSGLECSGGECTVPCRPAAASCSQTSDCCPGSGLNCSGGACMYACSEGGDICNAPGHSCCEGAGLTCNGVTCMQGCSAEGGSCSGAGTSCCEGFACNNGTCNANATCKLESEACNETGDCCEGFCTGGICAACVPQGSSCGGGETCCEGYACNGDTCEAVACLEQDDVCAQNSECCPDLFCTSPFPACMRPPCKRVKTICTTCVQSGNGCGEGETCCGGLACNNESGTCTACGENIGDSCDLDTPCCSGLDCIDGACGPACLPQGGTCSENGECCGGLVCNADSGTCTACAPVNEYCDAGSLCCGGLACDEKNNLCVACAPVNEYCDAGSLCCSGLVCDSRSSACVACSGSIGDRCDSNTLCCSGLACDEKNNLCVACAPADGYCDAGSLCCGGLACGGKNTCVACDKQDCSAGQKCCKGYTCNGLYCEAD